MRAEDQAIAELLARGGWELDDVQARHRRHPETFALPAPEELGALQPGDVARLIFHLVDQADPLRDGTSPYDEHGVPNLTTWCERMWVYVEKRDGDRFVGILQNVPCSSHISLTAGSRIEFHARDIIDTDKPTTGTMEDELAAMADIGFPLQPLEAAFEPVDAHRQREIGGPQQTTCDRHGVKPERPLPFAGMLVAPSLEDPNAWPVYGVRFAPDAERSDCGWAVWTREPDMQVVADTEGLQVMHFGHLRTLRPEAWQYLALPPGWVFTLQADGAEDVYFDPEAL